MSLPTADFALWQWDLDICLFQGVPNQKPNFGHVLVGSIVNSLNPTLNSEFNTIIAQGAQFRIRLLRFAQDGWMLHHGFADQVQNEIDVCVVADRKFNFVAVAEPLSDQFMIREAMKSSFGTTIDLPSKVSRIVARAPMPMIVPLSPIELHKITNCRLPFQS